MLGYYPFSLKKYLSVSLKTNFEKRKRDRISIFGILLDNQCRVKDAYKAFRGKRAPFASSENVKN